MALAIEDAAQALIDASQQRVADALEQEALEEAHQQRVVAAVAAAADRQATALRDLAMSDPVLLTQHALAEDLRTSDDGRGAIDDLPTRRRLAWQHAASAQDTSMGSDKSEDGRATTVGGADLVLSDDDEAPEQACGAKPMGVSPSGSLAMVVSGSAPPSPEAHHAHEDLPTASQLAIEPAEVADALAQSLETRAREAMRSSSPNSAYEAGEQLAMARSLDSFTDESRRDRGEAEELAAAIDASEMAAQHAELKDDEALAKGLQASLEISHPPERLRNSHVEAARQLGMRSAGLTWLQEATTAKAADATRRDAAVAAQDSQDLAPVTDGSQW